MTRNTFIAIFVPERIILTLSIYFLITPKGPNWIKQSAVVWTRFIII